MKKIFILSTLVLVACNMEENQLNPKCATELKEIQVTHNVSEGWSLALTCSIKNLDTDTCIGVPVLIQHNNNLIPGQRIVPPTNKCFVFTGYKSTGKNGVKGETAVVGFEPKYSFTHPIGYDMWRDMVYQDCLSNNGKDKDTSSEELAKLCACSSDYFMKNVRSIMKIKSDKRRSKKTDEFAKHLCKNVILECGSAPEFLNKYCK